VGAIGSAIAARHREGLRSPMRKLAAARAIRYQTVIVAC
jgi:hypothetical protein